MSIPLYLTDNVQKVKKPGAHLMKYDDKLITLRIDTATFYNILVEKSRKETNIESFDLELSSCDGAALLHNQRHKIPSAEGISTIIPHQVIVYSSSGRMLPVQKGLFINQNIMENKIHDILLRIKFLCLNNLKFTLAVVGDDHELVIIPAKYKLSSFSNPEERRRVFIDIIDKLSHMKKFCENNGYVIKSENENKYQINDKVFEDIKRDFNKEFTAQQENAEAKLFADFIFIFDRLACNNRRIKKHLDYIKFCAKAEVQNVLCKILDKIEKQSVEYNLKYKNLFLSLLLEIRPEDVIDALCFDPKTEKN